jgi:Putative Ig domain
VCSGFARAYEQRAHSEGYAPCVRTSGRGWAGRKLAGLSILVVSAGVWLWVPGPAGAQPTDVQAFMTLSPPGPGIAPHTPCPQTGRTQAGGTGTYGDPITFATDVDELPWCTEIYVPYMRRYFIHEDECSECDADWARYGLYRFDMWAGGDAQSVEQPEKSALLHCESTWTRADSISDPDNPVVEVDPPSGLPVATGPIFSASTGCWPGTILVTNPGKQKTARESPVNVQVAATDTIPGQTLSYAATHLPEGLSIDPGSGLISGSPTTTGRNVVTVTVSDSGASATARFVWVVTRR